MDIVLWAIAAALILQLFFVTWNLSQLPLLGGNGRGRAWLDGNAKHEGDRKQTEVAARPRLSILIPARDEAANIAACLHSVLVDPSPHLEVLVLDDGSTDGTADVAQDAAAGDPRVRILSGAALPPGWLGKSHACHQLAEAARGDWWLFLDADARLLPKALGAALDTALAQGQGLVTGFPLQETGTWMEKLVVPMMSFSIACHLPIRFVRQSADPRFVAAHGAFLLISAESYRATGGHASFKGQLVDDMELARAVKKAGHPVTLADVCSHVTMRMYHDAAGVWNGYKKNIFAGLGRSALLLGVVLAAYGLLYLVPPIFLLISLTAPLFSYAVSWLSGVLLPSLLCYLVGAGIKAIIDHKNKQPWWLGFCLPASIVMLSAIAVSSWRASLREQGYEWKGRKYS
ncbi:glycosyltransferase [Paenibacillus sp. y28]|uniref:glycosyltransferase n=1 Tax=Paenibacillus sp. y28 TaxID=3129110 RepID=UPI003016175B